MGRPPIGKVAMTSTERSRRRRERLRATSASATKPGGPATKPASATKPDRPATKPSRPAEIDRLQAKIRSLETEISRLKADATKPAGVAHTAGRREEFSAVGKREWMLLRGENSRLKSDNIKLKAQLQEAPDVAKLRKKVVDQQEELGKLRAERRQLAKERDEYKRATRYSSPKFREASHLLVPQTYRAVVNALHADRAQHVTPAELATAATLFIALRPLFEKDAKS